MKKVLISLIIISLAVVIGVKATQAWFLDTEQATDNSFTAGTLDLTVDGKDGSQVVSVVRTNMKPQAPYTFQGYNQQFVLKNVGSLPGTVSWKVKNIQNLENGCNEPETTMGDITCAANEGELGQYTWIQWSRNQAPWGSFGSRFSPLNTAEGVTVTGPILAPGETLAAYMWLDFPGRADNMENLAQGDGLKFDIEFTLNQIQP